LDGIDCLFTDLAPAEARKTRAEPPVEPETSAMPAYDSIGLDKNQGIHPSGPKAAQDHQEQSVDGREARLRTSTFEHGKLLAQRKDFQTEMVTRAEEAA